MRRSDREITSAEGREAVLAKGTVAHLALMDTDGGPYIVPLDYGWDGKHIYMHCANKGKKLDCIDADNRAALNIVSYAAMSDLAEANKACDLGTWYESATVFGRIHRVTDPAERAHGFAAILKQHGAGHLPFTDMPATVVLRVDIERLTAKTATPPPHAR